MRILAIETSCDETAIALVEAKGRLPAGRQGLNPSVGSGLRFKVLKNLVASQVKIHRPYGGVVPSLAKREHLKNLPILYRQVFANSKSEIRNPKQIPNSKFLPTGDLPRGDKVPKIDLICVTVGPGLEPCLWTGINFGKELYSKLKTENKKLKIVGVSHLEGHLYSNLLEPKTCNLKPKTLLPAVALLVSGGHTILLLMKDLIRYKKLGETRDDAVGECFDKVARLLNLPYPGGPEIEKIAKSGSSTSINFPRPMINQKNYDFSFSGLKTAVLYYLRDQKLTTHNSKLRANIAASFQVAAFDVLIYKTLRAAREFKAKSILISGGVASNNFLRNYLKFKIKNLKLKIKVLVPQKKFCTDNAVMIAAAGYLNYLKRKKRQLIAQGNLSLN